MIRRRFHLPEFLAALLTTAALAGCMPSLESSEPPARSYWLDAADAAGPVRVTASYGRLSASGTVEAGRSLVLTLGK